MLNGERGLLLGAERAEFGGGGGTIILREQKKPNLAEGAEGAECLFLEQKMSRISTTCSNLLSVTTGLYRATLSRPSSCAPAVSVYFVRQANKSELVNRACFLCCATISMFWIDCYIFSSTSSWYKKISVCRMNSFGGQN